jgi:hypothetical protein
LWREHIRGETLDFAARFGIATLPDPQIGIIHSEDTIVIGSDGRIRAKTGDSAWAPEDIVTQVVSAAADAAGRGGGQAALAYLGRRLYRAVFAQHV